MGSRFRVVEFYKAVSWNFVPGKLLSGWSFTKSCVLEFRSCEAAFGLWSFTKSCVLEFRSWEVDFGLCFLQKAVSWNFVLGKSLLGCGVLQKKKLCVGISFLGSRFWVGMRPLWARR